MVKICGIVLLIFAVLIAIETAIGYNSGGAWDYLDEDDYSLEEDNG